MPEGRINIWDWQWLWVILDVSFFLVFVFLPWERMLALSRDVNQLGKIVILTAGKKWSHKKPNSPLEISVIFIQENGGRPSYLTCLSSFLWLITFKYCDFPVHCQFYLFFFGISTFFPLLFSSGRRQCADEEIQMMTNRYSSPVSLLGVLLIGE